ncbi:HAMP domain-containing histidine kinase, partial [bacterium]|nr:HAMP domain-containing histidine kinase [bacterium]
NKIRVLALKKRKKLLIEVSNDGPEIPEEFRSSIFEPFYTTRKNGNGLGLAVCEKVVRLSGGTITLKESTQNITRFLISFPLEAVVSR